MQITITLPDTLSATSRDETVTTETAKLPINIVEAMVPHAFQQLLGDAAASAGKSAWESAHAGKDYDPRNTAHKDWVKANPALVKAQVIPLMQKRLDTLVKGEWTTRGTGEGLSSVTTLATLRLFKAALALDVAKRFAKLSASDQARKALDNASAFTAEAIAAEVAKIEAERKARADADAARKAQVAELATKIKIDF